MHCSHCSHTIQIIKALCPHEFKSAAYNSCMPLVSLQLNIIMHDMAASERMKQFPLLLLYFQDILSRSARLLSLFEQSIDFFLYVTPPISTPPTPTTPFPSTHAVLAVKKITNLGH